MAHTPGPWEWDVRPSTKTFRLITPHGGHMIVMDFTRWGMQSAQPRFSDRNGERCGGIMEDGSKIDLSKNPDARLIAAAPDLLEALKLCLPLVQNDVYELGSDSTCFYCGMEIDSGDEHKDDCPQLVAYLAVKAAITRAEGM